MNAAGTPDPSRRPATGVTIDSAPTLLPCLARLAQLQQESVDRLAVQEAAEAALAGADSSAVGQLNTVAAHLQVQASSLAHAPRCRANSCAAPCFVRHAPWSVGCVAG